MMVPVVKPSPVVFFARVKNGSKDCEYQSVTQDPQGTEAHVNNVELGKRGRWRSNVWTYPGASSLGSDARRGLREHATVKPVVMLEDALLDLSHRGDIVDPKAREMVLRRRSSRAWVV